MHVQEETDPVQKEIKNTFHTVDTDAFLGGIFPLDPRSESDILKQLGERGLYAGRRWTKFPKQPISGQEKLLYEPFAEACNAIVDALPDDAVGTKIVYVDRHTTTPHSHNLDMAASRPDGAGVSPSENMKELEARIIEHEASIQSTKRTTRQKTEAIEKEKASSRAARSPKLKELIELYTLWWLQIHVVYEIKNTTAERYDGLTQLLTHLRQLLIEQLDRRFVMGLLLCFDELTVVMCDRSGMMATGTPINIHKDPKRFIRVLAGLSRMRPEELGWDTAMKMYLPSLDDVTSSYNVGPKFQRVYGNSRYHTHWVIDVVVGDEVVKYVTVSIISAPRSGEICGRATVVYQVIKYEERFDPTETFALKRYWRPLEKDHPERYPSEGEIYDILDKARSTRPKHICASHDIKINDEIDSTFGLIRRDLQVLPYKHPVTPYPSENENDTNHEPLQPHRSIIGHDPTPNPSTLELVDRCHTNILMPMGDVIKVACSHHELLKCFRDLVTDHKNAQNQLTLRRDISGGNLFIFKDENGQVLERLMDYDHAKRAEKSLPIPCIQLNSRKDPWKALNFFHSGLEDAYEITYNVDDSVAFEALGHCGPPFKAVIYVLDVIKKHSSFGDEWDSSRTIHRADLGWEHDDKVETWPVYDDCEYRKGDRTGTPPYMSAEVISRMTFYTPPAYNERPPFVHAAIHDVESLLWVLVHLCMTRKGPGIHMKRPELDDSSANYDSSLRDAILRYFEGNERLLKESKFYLLINPDTFENKIIAHFHTYFEPLKQLARQWWAILILGYMYRGNEYYNIHSHIICRIGKTLDTIPDAPTEDTTKELKRREERPWQYMDTFKPRPEDPSAATPSRSSTPAVLATPPNHRPAPQRRSFSGSPASRQPAKKRRT
ncbi:hypothetical protein DXG01_003569 [Tephrocybe rancida]|nr:hypothetical protein DXG01_003569 [Tephrocybe rancida]